MLLTFFSLFLLKFNICYANSKQKVSVYENNVVDNFMNSSSYKSLVGINKNNGNFETFMTPSAKRIEIKKSFSCGDHSFPHGIFIDRKTKSPKMYCEPHKCFKPKYIECFKNVPFDECKFDNEWIAGFIQRKNQTHQWLEVECCHYKRGNEGKFIKTIYITVNADYIHNIVVRNGKMSEFDIANNIQKLKMENGSIFYFVDIYRMKCPTDEEFEVIDLNWPSLVQHLNGITISSRDGISVLEEGVDIEDQPYMIPRVKKIKLETLKNCGKNLFPHAFFFQWLYFFPKVYCEPHSCLKPEKVTCIQKSPISSCSESNEWVAGFITVNATVKVECCHYQEPLETTFVKRINITEIKTYIHDVNFVSHNHFEMGFINTVKRIRSPKEGTIFEASVYRMICPVFTNDNNKNNG